MKYPLRWVASVCSVFAAVSTVATVNAQELVGPSPLVSQAVPLYELSTNTSSAAAVGTARIAPSSLAKLGLRKAGERVQLPVAGGATLEGVINLVQREGHEVQIGGALIGNRGSFSLASDGKSLQGNILQFEKKSGYVFASGSQGAPLLQSKPLDLIICPDLPRPKNERARPAASGRRVAGIPIFNSRPNAVAQIYLDLDGEVVSGTDWNDGETIVAPAYDLTPAEIQEIFDRVKEDFSTWDVNVTTSLDKFSSAPVSQRMQCIVTPNDAAMPGSGGVAYVGSFGTGTPCWVFNSQPNDIADAASHEVGHTLGLRHDGTAVYTYYSGHTSPSGPSWGPIMGAPYDMVASQWSKGEYAGANNQQDDIEIISSRLSRIADESGGTRATAGRVTYASPGVPSISGIITNSSDIDYYAFSTSGGAVTLKAGVGTMGTDLDVRIQIEDGTGKVLASANPLDTLDATITTTLAAGTYFLKVQGAGIPQPPDTGYTTYGSIGGYSISGTVPGGASRSAQAVLLTPADGSGVTGTYAVSAKITGDAPVQAMQFDYRGQSTTLSRAPKLAIPDQDTVSDSITSSGTPPLASVSVNITHSYVGDLTVTLVAPDGTRFNLPLYSSGSGDTYQNTFDVSATFGKRQLSGQWNLLVADVAREDEGVLNSWSLTFQDTNWTPLATVNAVGGDGTWRASWDTARIRTGIYEVRATPVVDASNSGASDTNSNIKVAGYNPPTVSVSDVAVPEGNSETKTATFTVSLSAATFETVTGEARLLAGTATEGKDYAKLSLVKLSFAPGETSKTVTVSIIGDLLDEPDEKFSLLVENITNSSTGSATGTATIQDDDAVPSLSVAAATAKESYAGGTTSLNFDVLLSAPSGQSVTVQYQTAPAASLPATPNVDYTPLPLSTLTFEPGQKSKRVSLTILGDDLDEADERLTLQLSGAINATPGTLSATGTITDEDALPQITSGDVVYVIEKDSSNATANFNITLSAPSGRAVTVKVATLARTAKADVDFVSMPATLLTFNPGETSKTVSVAVKYDLLDESDETFALVLSAPVNALIATNTAQCIIQDNDPTPSISVASVSATEGSGTKTVLTFTVKLSKPSGLPVSLSYVTGDDTATAVTDYVPLKSSILKFAPGETSKTIAVSLVPDLLDEASERFNLYLSNPVNASLPKGSAIGTILDDDKAPTLSVADVSVKELNGEYRVARFVLTLSATSGLPVTVNWNTLAGLTLPATGNTDYAVQAVQTLTIAPGQKTATIDVPIYGDTLDELDETFRLVLSQAKGATLADGEAVATIVDDDSAPTMSVSDVTIGEGTGGTQSADFTFSLSAASGLPIKVNYQTVNKSAIGGSDFTALPATKLTFAPGETYKTVSVSVVTDALDENDEQFALQLSAVGNAVLERSSALATIQNDDSMPSISVSEASVTEGDGTAKLQFTATLSAPSGKTISFKAKSDDANSGAMANLDYTALADTRFTFAPGVTSLTISVPVKADLLDEHDESVLLSLSASVNAWLSVSSVTGTIADDDATPSVSVESISVNEGEAGTTNAVVTVKLDAPSGRTISVNIGSQALTTDTAIPGRDFGLWATSVTFMPGQTEQQVTFSVYGDLEAESDETFSVVLDVPINVELGVAQGTVTILNDDTQEAQIQAPAVPSSPSSGTSSEALPSVNRG